MYYIYHSDSTKVMTFELYYRLDKADRIVETGGAWDRLAQENAGTDLLSASIVGRSLYDYIHGDVSRMFVRTLVNGVRTLGRPRTVPYRCDSPGVRRFMEMSLFREASGSILVEHRQLRTEAIQRKFDFKAGVALGRQMIIRCSHCNAVKNNGTWGEAEDLLPEGNTQVPVIYGVCQTCLSLVKRS